MRPSHQEAALRIVSQMMVKQDRATTFERKAVRTQNSVEALEEVPQVINNQNQVKGQGRQVNMSYVRHTH